MSEHSAALTPYKGLMPYSEQDAQFFFGREQKREVITANLIASRLTLLYGPSGVGKSSVLRAGVVHRLRAQEAASLDAGEVPDTVVVVFDAWRDDPLAGLARAVRDALAPVVRRAPAPPLALGKLDAFLLAREPGQPSAAGLFEALKELTTVDPAGRRATVDLLVILDQFEEYFLYHAKEEGEGTFAVEFPRLVNSAELGLNFLVSMRDDSLAALDRFKGRINNLFTNRLGLDRLDREAAREAVVKPLRQYNKLRAREGRPALDPEAAAAPPPDGQVAVEPALVEEVLRQVKTGQVVLGQTGGGAVRSADGGRDGGLSEPDPSDIRIETPFLQLVLTRLWEEETGAGSRVLRLQTFNRLGGAKQIVQGHLRAVMEKLDADEQDLAARLFYHLVTPSGTKIAHTVNDLTAFTRQPGDPSGRDERRGRVRSVLVKLALAPDRILRAHPAPPNSPDPDGEDRYEIFHDVLASAILDWQTQYTQARETDETKRQADEQRRRADEAAASARRFRRLTFALALVSILALATAAYAFTQQREAARNRRNAEQQYAHAERQRGLAADAERRAANERRKTEAEAARAESEKQAANEAQAAAERRQRENRELIAANEQRKREADAAQAQAEKARSAALAAKAALEQQKTLSTEQQQIEQMLLNAQTTQRTGNSETAAARYEEALARLERLNAGFARPNYRALANTHYLTGEAYSGITLTALEGHFFNVGKTDEASVKQIAQRQEAARREALKHFNAAVELYGKHAELTGEHFELAAAYSTLAKQYEQVSTRAVDRALASNQAQLENAKRAIGFYEQALWLYERPSLSDPTPKPREVIAMLGKLANLYTIIDKRKAITHYERLLAALRDIRNDSGRIVVLQSLARLHRDAEINQPRKALEYLKEADQLYAPNENSAFMRVPLLEGIAELHLRLDEKQQALDSYLTIYGIYEGGAKSGWSAPPGIRLKIADLYYWRGEKEKALGFYDAALGNFRPNAIDFALLDPVARQKAKREEGKVHQNMGQLYLEKGNKMKAATAFWLAVAAYQAGGDAAAADGLRGTRAKLCATLSEVEKLLAGCQSAAEVRPETPKPEK